MQAAIGYERKAEYDARPDVRGEIKKTHTRTRCERGRDGKQMREGRDANERGEGGKGKEEEKRGGRGGKEKVRRPTGACPNGPGKRREF